MCNAARRRKSRENLSLSYRTTESPLSISAFQLMHEKESRRRWATFRSWWDSKTVHRWFEPMFEPWFEPLLNLTTTSEAYLSNFDMNCSAVSCFEFDSIIRLKRCIFSARAVLIIQSRNLCWKLVVNSIKFSTGLMSKIAKHFGNALILAQNQRAEISPNGMHCKNWPHHESSNR